MKIFLFILYIYGCFIVVGICYHISGGRFYGLPISVFGVTVWYMLFTIYSKINHPDV